MREIKFRAWDKVRGEMERFNLGHKDGLLYTDGNWWVSTGYDGEDNPTFDDDNVPRRYELMQFTGLHDKDGKEIYEGDILLSQDDDLETHWRDHNGAVHLLDNCGTSPVEWLDDLGGWYLPREINNALADILRNNVVSVIGNIYENPELLNND